MVVNESVIKTYLVWEQRECQLKLAKDANDAGGCSVSKSSSLVFRLIRLSDRPALSVFLAIFCDVRALN